jgi:hypothetical protein
MANGPGLQSSKRLQHSESLRCLLYHTKVSQRQLASLTKSNALKCPRVQLATQVHRDRVLEIHTLRRTESFQAQT